MRFVLTSATVDSGSRLATQLVVTQELTRIAARGYGDGLLGGKVIGLPPVINFGSEELKARIVPDVLAGRKFICLAISEAFAGSDVVGLQTTANKTEDGKFWIVNGTKKWITNGTYVATLSSPGGITTECRHTGLLTISRSGARPRTGSP
jgi:alkylation response protein AidB-like acyl-CoA dehydrogenase